MTNTTWSVLSTTDKADAETFKYSCFLIFQIKKISKNKQNLYFIILGVDSEESFDLMITEPGEEKEVLNMCVQLGTRCNF